jgi:hypothetical protein
MPRPLEYASGAQGVAVARVLAFSRCSMKCYRSSLTHNVAYAGSQHGGKHSPP